MIVTKEVSVKITVKNINYLSKLGYLNLKYNDNITIPIKLLPLKSNKEIEVKCSVCGYNKFKKYSDYNRSTTNNSEEYFCIKCFPLKRKNIWLDKYGVDHPMKDLSISNKASNNINNRTTSEKNKQKQKFIKTCLSKYGVKNPSFNKDILLKSKSTKIKNNNQIPDELLSDFELYRRKVRVLTKKSKIQLLEFWNGFDFYDGEYIKDNFKLKYYDKKYPTIDHKISILNGFIDKIPEEKIASLDNICFTKKIINSTKNSKSFFISK